MGVHVGLSVALVNYLKRDFNVTLTKSSLNVLYINSWVSFAVNPMVVTAE